MSDTPIDEIVHLIKLAGHVQKYGYLILALCSVISTICAFLVLVYAYKRGSLSKMQL